MFATLKALYILAEVYPYQPIARAIADTSSKKETQDSNNLKHRPYIGSYAGGAI